MLRGRKSNVTMEPRIKGHITYDNGVSWIVNRLRRREVARFEYHHFTAFKIELRVRAGTFEAKVRVGRNEHTDTVALQWRPAELARKFDLRSDDAHTLATLLGDIGAALG